MVRFSSYAVQKEIETSVWNSIAKS